MNANAVATRYPNAFGSYGLVINSVVPLSNTSVVTTLPISGATNYIIRRVTVSLPSGNIANANIIVSTTSDGGNAVAGNVTLANCTTANTTWQDLTLATGAATTSYTAQALYVKVQAASAANLTCQIAVYADVVTL